VPLWFWSPIKGFGLIPDLMIPALGSCPGGGGDLDGADLHGGGQAASGQSLQGATGKVRVPDTGQPWGKLPRPF
jgi:hypothetical protein